MADTLSKVIGSVCRRANQPVPASYVSSSEKGALQWLDLAIEVGEDIRARFDYPTLKQQYTFDTVSGQKRYPLPGNFHRLLLDTQYDQDNQWALIGPASDHSIAATENELITNDSYYKFRVVGAPYQKVDETSFDESDAFIELSPTPSDARTLVFEYITNYWVFPVQWVASTAYTSGDLVSANGYIYKATSTGTANTTRPSGESTTAGETGVSFQLWRNSYKDPVSDNDIVLFDRHIMTLGIYSKWLQVKGYDYTQVRVDYDRALKNDVARFQGKKSINGDMRETLGLPRITNGSLSTGWPS